MTYNMLLKMIEKGSYDKEDLLNKIDTFYANNRITQEQYIELLAKLESQGTQQNWFVDGWGNVTIHTPKINRNQGEITCDKTTDGFINTKSISVPTAMYCGEER